MAGTRPRRSLSASNSFTPAEIIVLDHILAKLRKGHSYDPVTGNTAYLSVCRKVQKMKFRLREEQARRRLVAQTSES